MHFLGVKKWYCTIYAIVFSDTKQRHVCWKIFKVKKVFGYVAGAYIFNVNEVEVHKMNEFFEQNCIVE